MIMVLKNCPNSPKFYEFIRFCIVGAFATILDAAIFYTVIRFASYRTALVCGYLISLIANYFLTVLWTFKKKPSKKNALGVLIAHLLNLFVVRMGLMFMFINKVGIDDDLAYIPTLAISTITNFFVVRFFVYSFSKNK